MATVKPSADEQSAFDNERAAILSTAVGIARVRLDSGDAVGAKEALDEACVKTDRRLREFLQSQGYEESAIAAFLGPPVQPSPPGQVEHGELLQLLRIYSHALQNACEGDRQRGLELVHSARAELGIELPEISCAIASATEGLSIDG